MALQVKAHTDPVRARVRATPRVLVVDDQPDVRELLATALGLEGYRVDEAANAHQGLRHLETRRYALVVSDYAMPGGTGVWMIQEARRLGLMKHTVAIIVTAHTDVRQLAGIAVMTKPIDLDEFLDQIRETLPNTAPIDARAPASSTRSRAKQKRK